MADDGGESTGGPLGGVPLAIAVFFITPASMSAGAATYVPEHVVDASGASVVAGHVIGPTRPVPPTVKMSLTVRLVRVSDPVFVTLNV